MSGSTRSAKATAKRPSLRDQQADLTRDLIIRAFHALLVDDHPDAITFPQVAEAAGVSLRTVYRYFPSRADLMAGAWAWWDELTHGQDWTDPATITDMTRILPELGRLFDEHTNLFRALIDAGDRAGTRKAAAIAAVEAVADALPAQDVRIAAAVVGCLRSGSSWLTLHDEYGLSGAEILQALDWAARLLVKDVARRNAAARRHAAADR